MVKFKLYTECSANASPVDVLLIDCEFMMNRSITSHVARVDTKRSTERVLRQSIQNLVILSSDRQINKKSENNPLFVLFTRIGSR